MALLRCRAAAAAFPRVHPAVSRKRAQQRCSASMSAGETGKKHWHALLKARAIENFCYIFAPAQSGINYPGRKTFGHSLIVSPDGEILNELEVNEGIISSKIDPLLPYKLREKIPSLNID